MNGIQVKRLGQSIPKMSLGGVLTNTASGALSGGMTAGPWGAVAMGGISLISGLLGEANENKMEKERKLAEAKVAQRNRYINDAMRYSNFNKNGNSDNRMYMANGGIVKVKLQKPATKTTNPVESNTPVKQDYVDNGWLDNLGRYVALTPNKINTAADALFSPVTQMGMKSGSHPFQKRYWDNISAAIDDANDITPYEWNNAYSNLGAESAYSAANLIGGKAASGLASATGKAVAPYVSKMTPYIKNPLTKVATKVGNAIKNEAGYIYEGITSKPISKTKVAPKGTGNINVPLEVPPLKTGMVYDMPERIVPQISQTSSYVPPVKTARVVPSIPTEITGSKMIPPIQTIPYVKPPLSPTKDMSKFIKYHAESDMNMPYDDFMKLYDTYPWFKNKVNKAIGMSKGGIVKPIAPGVDKVKASKVGTDTVKHNLQGQPVMLDNNEIIINDNVVLSADKGHAQQYESLLKAGYPKAQLDAIFIPKAIAGQMSNRSLSLGGSPDNPPISKPSYWDIGREDGKLFHLATMRYVDPPGQTTSDMEYAQGFQQAIRKPLEKEAVLGGLPNVQSSRKGINTKANIVSPYMNLGSEQFSTPDTMVPRTTINPPPSLRTRPTPIKPNSDMPYSLVGDFKYGINKGIQSFKDMPMDKKQLLGQMGMAGLQLLGNTINSNKANKLKIPNPTLITPIQQDRTVNDPLYAAQESQLLSSISNMNSNALNTSNSATAFARLGAGVQYGQQELGKINAGRIGSRGQIDNENVRLINAAMDKNSQSLNQYGLMDYQSKADNLTNRSNVFNASMDTLSNIMTYKEKGEYDDDMLSAIAKTYNIDYTPGDGIEELYKKATGNAKKQLALLRK